MVIERLGNPEKFLRVSEAVTATPDPPARPCIPSKLACARAGVNADATQLRLPTDAPLRRLP
ncbi:MAG: hypothetical protein OXFUSZZB_001152 [Candidatus Fervidibacter sp.]|jgi:hypothetical protein